MEKLGNWWNGRDIEIYKIQGKNIALYGWNSEIYGDCFEVDESLTNIICENIEVKPIYQKVDNEDDWEIINFEII